MTLDYLKNVNLSKRNIFVAALVPIIAVALYNWFVSPQLQYLKAAQEYGAAVDKIEKTNKLLDSQVQLCRRRLDEISRQFEQKKQDFFALDSARVFLGSIQSNAAAHQCTVDALQFPPVQQISAPDSSVDIKQYQAVLTITGQYPNIVKLLDTLQNRNRLASSQRSGKVWLDSIKLQHKDPMSDLLVCDLSLSIYTLREKEMISDVNSNE